MEGGSEATIYDDLRARALGAADLRLPHRIADHPDVEGIVVDIPASDGFATLVALCDGTTSLYTSPGGGTIGAGQQVAVADATSQALVAFQRSLELLSDNSSTEHPGEDQVRLFALTPGGRRVADVKAPAFWGETPTELAVLVEAAQSVIAAVRSADPPKG